MSRTRTFAKIILVSVGLLTAIRVAPQLLTLIYLIPKNHMVDRPAMVLVQIVITTVFLALLFYVFWIKRDWLATRVVGAEPSSELSVPWLPAAYRLVCMAAGLQCLYVVSFEILRFFLSPAYAARFPDAGRMSPSAMDIVTWIILLAAGFYLIWGAPHFVRWHMKKTLEQCREITDAG